MFALRRAASRAVAARGSFHPSRTALRAFANQCPHDPSKPYHKSPLSLESSGGLLEYSVVYTDRAMNHMSKPFCKVRMVGWGGQARDVRHTSRVLRNGRKKERDKPVFRLGSGPRPRARLWQCREKPDPLRRRIVRLIHEPRPPMLCGRKHDANTPPTRTPQRLPADEMHRQQTCIARVLSRDSDSPENAWTRR